MKNFLRINWLIGLLLLGYTQTLAQVTYRVGYESGTGRYRVYMTSTASYTGNQARISTAQVTLLVPHATGPSQFVVTSQQNKQVGSNTMIWNLNARVDAPIENPSTDYLSFGFSGSGSPVLFDIPANTEIELFSFVNTGPCLRAISLINNTNDPFMNLNGNNNSLNTNPGNQITILGRGGDAYSGNYGGAANCAPIGPDLSAAISGPASVSAGGSATYVLSASNVSSAATTGATTQSITLAAGLSYTGFSGAGWTVSSSAGAGGTTILTATYSAIIAGNAAATALSINVTGNASGAIAGAVSTAGDANAANNSYSLAVSVTGQTAVADLSATIAGPASATAGTAASYIISVSNSGSAATTGATTQSITLAAGLSYTGFSGAGWTVSSSAGAGGTTILTATYSAILAAGGSASALTLSVTPTSAVAGSSVSIAGMVSTAGEVNTSNNAYSQAIGVVAAAPAISAGLSGPATVTVGSPASYSLALTNSGNAPTTGPVTTTLSLPAGLAYTGFSGAGWTVSSSAGLNGTTILTATYSPTVGAGGTLPALVVNTNPTVPGSVTISGSTSTPGGTGDSFSQPIQIQPASSGTPDPSAGIAGLTTISPNSPATYTLTVSNVGTGAYTGTTTTQTTLASGFTYTGSTGAGWSCSSVVAADGKTIVTCSTTTSIAVGSALPPLLLTVTASNTQTSAVQLPISGTLLVAGDVNLSNNAYNLPVMVSGTTTQPGSGTANLATTVQVSNQNPNQYEPVRAVIVVTNTGPNATTGVTTQVTLPSGQPITSLTASSGTAFVSGTGVWNIGTLAPGQSVTLTVTLSANTGGLAFVSNAITSSGAIDPDLTNNEASACFTVPLNLCTGRSIDVGIPNSYTGIQWFRDGQPIAGATSPNLTITASGTYTVRSNNSCLSGNCCGIVVRDSTDCCAPSVCIPFVVRRIR